MLFWYQEEVIGTRQNILLRCHLKKAALLFFKEITSWIFFKSKSDFNLCSEQFRRVFSEIKKDGEFHQCCGLSWNGNSCVLGRKRCEFSHWSKQLTYLSPGVKSGSQITCELLTIRFTYLFISVGGVLDTSIAGLGRKSHHGAVYRTNEYMENPFLDPCIEKCPSKDFIVIPSFIEQIHSQS